jgi:hypothetical protein
MKRYIRVMLGPKSVYASQCYEGNFIGADFDIKEDLAEKDQIVKGVIIGLDDDVRIRRALSVTNNIEFYRYKVNFQLFKS